MALPGFISSEVNSLKNAFYKHRFMYSNSKDQSRHIIPSYEVRWGDEIWECEDHAHGTVCSFVGVIA